jgi:tetratricopeptide (TPR) repeat protein
LGLLKEAVAFGERAQEISKLLESDQYLYFKSLGGLGFAYALIGEYKKASEAGKALLDYGRRLSNIRSLAMGHIVIGGSHWGAGEFTKAVECAEAALQISQEPFYSQIGRSYLGSWSFMGGRLQEAEEALTEVLKFSQEFGAEVLGDRARQFLGAILVMKGQMNQGLKMLEDVRVASLKDKNRFLYASTEYLMGKVYLQIVQGREERISLSTVARNIGFLIREVPFASKKAEDHFNEAITVAKEAGIKGILGQAYLDLGLLHKLKGKADKARECISNAEEVFEQCDAELYRKQAREALASLG